MFEPNSSPMEWKMKPEQMAFWACYKSDSFYINYEIPKFTVETTSLQPDATMVLVTQCCVEKLEKETKFTL